MDDEARRKLQSWVRRRDERNMTMGLLFGGALMLFTLTMLLLFAVVHVLFSIPLWLLIGGAVLYLWLRKGGRRNRYLSSGRFGGYLGSRSRW
jgi:hypothetical protein